MLISHSLCVYAYISLITYFLLLAPCFLRESLVWGKGHTPAVCVVWFFLTIFISSIQFVAEEHEYECFSLTLKRKLLVESLLIPLKLAVLLSVFKPMYYSFLLLVKCCSVSYWLLFVFQGDIVDNIEQNVSKSVDHITAAKEQTKKAVRYQTKARKVM